VDRRDELIRSGLSLASELSLEAVLQRIVEIAVELTGATYGALGVLGPDGRIIEFITKGVTPEQRAAIGDPPTGHGILGLLIREARPIRIPRIADHPASFGFPANHPPMTSFLGAPVTARGHVYGNIYLTEKRGAAEFDEKDEAALVVLAAQAGIAVENARLHEEAHTRERWLEGVREISLGFLSGTPAGDVLDLVARLAKELADADLSTVAILEPAGESLVIRAAAGSEADEILGSSFPLTGSVSGDVARSGEPIVIDDAGTDDRIGEPMVAIADLGPAILVPLSSRNRAFGTLAVARRQGERRFDPETLRLLGTFAASAATALEYDRAQQELHRLAVLEDRERIAKELHDGVIQSLFAVGMNLQGTAVLSADPDLEQRIEAAVNEIDRVIRDLRNYIFGLRPGILADRQLDQALRDLAEDFQARAGVVTVVDIDPEIAAELTSSATDLIQITREALSNVGRHAQASTCRVTLRRSDGAAVLEIDDDGRGFDQDGHEGQGLPNLRDRAESLGGKAEIESSPTDGTTVRIMVPLD